jgi:hypothetical protein
MADSRDGRDKQARDEENRQRMRAMLEELERGDETEPEVEDADLDDLAADLEAVSYPAPPEAVVDAVGDRRLRAGERTFRVAELIPEDDEVSFDDAKTVRARVERPTIAAAMKRVVEAARTAEGDGFGTSQRKAYERTFRELQAIDAVDDDAGIDVIADWIVERIAETGATPGSRDVRRRAAKFCRSQGYTVGNDEWLGV